VFDIAEASRHFRAQFGRIPIPILTKPYTAERLRKIIADVVARDV
jgi:hypothetical protein